MYVQSLCAVGNTVDLVDLWISLVQVHTCDGGYTTKSLTRILGSENPLCFRVDDVEFLLDLELLNEIVSLSLEPFSLHFHRVCWRFRNVSTRNCGEGVATDRIAVFCRFG